MIFLTEKDFQLFIALLKSWSGPPIITSNYQSKIFGSAYSEDKIRNSMQLSGLELETAGMRRLHLLLCHNRLFELLEKKFELFCIVSQILASVRYFKSQK